MHNLVSLGWREYVTLPDLGLGAIKAKIDTGARTSALHIDWLEEIQRDGETWLRFAVDTLRHRTPSTVCEAKATDRRNVTDSGGNTAARWFIRTTISLADKCFRGLHPSEKEPACAAESSLPRPGTLLLFRSRSATESRSGQEQSPRVREIDRQRGLAREVVPLDRA